MSDGLLAASTGWAFVDVETTGLNPSWDRVVSLSVLAFDDEGRFESELHTLLDPGRDPGPTHIHGLTAAMLDGSPTFGLIAPAAANLLRGRVLVAHNARFDYEFLHAEAARSSSPLPTTHRLCTIALSRRLDLPVRDHRLATVAAYWNVTQRAAHDARDDVRVLREVFWHSQRLAAQLGVKLPVMACSGRGAVVYPSKVARVPSRYSNPRTWAPPAPLVQGMKMAISGPTRRARLDLAKDLSSRGFDIMNSVSGQTRLLVCNDHDYLSDKVAKARANGIPIMSEASLAALLDHVQPGTLRGESTKRPTASSGTASEAPAVALGPWAGRSVLVLGGTPEQAAKARERAGELGARVLVNLGARTTHALMLEGAERDRRLEKIRERAIPILRITDLDASAIGQRTEKSTSEHLQPAVLGRGHVIDLEESLARLAVSASWEPNRQPHNHPYEVDVVAFALQDSETLERDEDFVFYNQPSTPDGGIRLTIDGSCEQGIDLDLEALPEGTTRIRVAAVIDGEATFGDVGAIRLTLANADSGIEVASSTLDAATEERSLVLAEIYQRRGAWRFRTVGRGYTHGLKELVTSHGIEVD